MTKIVVFGEYKLERMIEPLHRMGCDEIVVYTEVPLNGMVPPAVAQRSLRADCTRDDVLRVLEDEAPDVATTSMYALTQEQLLPVYAAAAAGWAGRFVVHPPRFAELASDKVELYRTGRRRGWPMPAGEVCVSAVQAHEVASRIGYPVMVKAARTQAGSGVHRVEGPDRLDAALGSFPVLVTEFCRGIEVGVELVSGTAVTVRWPVESAGQLDAACAPLRRPRVSPYELPPSAAADLDALIDDLVRTYRPWGGWQLDLGVVDGRLRLFELNGRLGGLTELGLASTGVDAHEVHAAECLGRELPQPRPHRVGLELTGTAGAHPALLTEDMTLTEITWNATHRSLQGTGLAQYIIGVSRPQDGARWVHTMARRGLRADPDTAIRQLDAGFTALAAGTAGRA